MANCPNGTEVSRRKDFTFIVKGCTENDVKSKLESKLLDIAKQIRADDRTPCEGECGRAEGEEEQPTCTLWVDYILTMNHIRAARVKGCPNDVGRIGFFSGSVTNAGCNCV